MEFFVDFFKVSIRNVGVDLGGGDVAVAEHGLDASKVGAVHEKVGGEAVAHGVGANVLRNARQASIFTNHALDRARREPSEVTAGVGFDILAVADE